MCNQSIKGWLDLYKTRYFLPNGPFTKTKPCSEKVIEVLMEERKPHKSGPQVDITSKFNLSLNKLNEKNIFLDISRMLLSKSLNLSDLHYDCYPVEICGEPLLCICLPCFNRLLLLHHSKSTLS